MVFKIYRMDIMVVTIKVDNGWIIIVIDKMKTGYIILYYVIGRVYHDIPNTIRVIIGVTQWRLYIKIAGQVASVVLRLAPDGNISFFCYEFPAHSASKILHFCSYLKRGKTSICLEVSNTRNNQYIM